MDAKQTAAVKMRGEAFLLALLQALFELPRETI
jgi:hypothetical protein